MNPSLADPDRLRVGGRGWGVFKGILGTGPPPLIFGALDALIGGGGAVRAEGTAMGGGSGDTATVLFKGCISPRPLSCEAYLK